MQIDVLPVWRSPMISSRWPRPMLVIASIGLMPVISGSFTGWRATTPGALNSAGPGLGGVDVALAVERLAERVDDAAEQLVAHRHLEQAAGALDLVALLDLVPLAEQHGADVVGLEVEREAGHVVGQLEQLHGHGVVEPVDARDAVGDRQHRAHLGQVGAAVLEPLDALLEDAGDLVWLDLHLGGLLRSPWPLAFEVVRVGCARWRRAPCCPTRTIRPPSTSGSTFDDSSTRRRSAPRCACRCPRRGPASSSVALVTVTGSSLFSSAHRPSKMRRIRNRAGMRWRSASSSRKLTRRSSASVTIRRTPSFFSSLEK